MAQLKPTWSDLSPDGKLLAYFASNRHGYDGKKLRGFEDSWTAISRPPYFSPLAVFPSQGTWHGGGTFPDNRTFHLEGYASFYDRDNTPWLDHPPKYHPLYPPTGIATEYIPSKFSDYPDIGSTSQLRKIKSGWKVIQFATRENSIVIYSKKHPSRTENLLEHQIFSDIDDPYHYELEKRGKITPLENVDWADYDHRGRLVYAKGGTLWARLENGGHRQLADFTNRTFRKLPPPDDALQW